jgi:hypothetical protein
MIDRLYFGDLASKIQEAHRLFRCHGQSLLENPEVSAGIRELNRLDDALQGVMRVMGMDEECAECGRELEGGCCSDEMAGETYALLLLIVLLAGGEVCEQTREGLGCRFLGSSGCRLKFKPFICINYRCRKMVAGHAPEDCAALEHATSALLNQIVAVEELLCRELEDAPQA